MTFSLYAAVVPGFLQILESVEGLVGKAEAHCAEHVLAPEEIIQARLAEDMHPFAYQVKSTVVHSLGAIEGVRSGQFSPDQTPPPDSFAALKQRVSEARDRLAAVEPSEVDALVGRDMLFTIGQSFRREFTAENFLLSFSVPNFYFHATTAYGLLRAKGLPIGKVDFLGRMAVKG